MLLKAEFISSDTFCASVLCPSLTDEIAKRVPVSYADGSREGTVCSGISVCLCLSFFCTISLNHCS